MFLVINRFSGQVRARFDNQEEASAMAIYYTGINGAFIAVARRQLHIGENF
jgi:hypothetical protein